MYQWIFDYATYCCSTSHRYSISLRSGSCGVHLHTLKLLYVQETSLNEFWCIILLKVAIRGCDHKGMDNPEQQYSVCLNDKLGALIPAFFQSKASTLHHHHLNHWYKAQWIQAFMLFDRNYDPTLHNVTADI